MKYDHGIYLFDYLTGLVLLKAVDRTPATTFLLKRPGLGEVSSHGYYSISTVHIKSSITSKYH